MNVLPRLIVFIACLLFLVGLARGQDATDLMERFAPGSIQSIEAADAALAAVAEERRRVDARFAQEEQACTSDFFVTRCVEKAKERRRQVAIALDSIELEAQRHKRQERALQRDRALEERRLRRDENEPVSTVNAYEAPARKKAARMDAGARPERVDRVKPEPTAEELAQEAQRRAESEAAYTRKAEAAKRRQDAIARNKAEQERLRTAR
jgi:colicin import membrane protein